MDVEVKAKTPEEIEALLDQRIIDSLRDSDVQMDSADCKKYRASHPNCVGCESQKTCVEYFRRFLQYVCLVAKETGFPSKNLELLADSFLEDDLISLEMLSDLLKDETEKKKETT